jgi:hypothetical protein
MTCEPWDRFRARTIVHSMNRHCSPIGLRPISVELRCLKPNKELWRLAARWHSWCIQHRRTTSYVLAETCRIRTHEFCRDVALPPVPPPRVMWDGMWDTGFREARSSCAEALSGTMRHTRGRATDTSPPRSSLPWRSVELSRQVAESEGFEPLRNQSKINKLLIYF